MDIMSINWITTGLLSHKPSGEHICNIFEDLVDKFFNLQIKAGRGGRRSALAGLILV